jgi:hypothetical protein
MSAKLKTTAATADALVKNRSRIKRKATQRDYNEMFGAFTDGFVTDAQSKLMTQSVEQKVDLLAGERVTATEALAAIDAKIPEAAPDPASQAVVVYDGDNSKHLKTIAKKIWSLGKKDIASVIEKGRLLQEAFDSFDHGDRDEYHAWVAGELDISRSQEARYREVFEFDQICQTGKFGEQIKIADLDISKTALYDLAHFSDALYEPETIVKVLTLASKGRVMLADVNQIYAEDAAAADAAAAPDRMSEDELIAADAAGDDPGAGSDDAGTAPSTVDEPEIQAEAEPASDDGRSARALREFETACQIWLPRLNAADLEKAKVYVAGDGWRGVVQ